MTDQTVAVRAPFRNAFFAPRALEVDWRAGGELVLTNPAKFAQPFATMTDPLEHWAQAAPDRVWLAERSGDGWRTVTFREGRERVRALAGGLAGLGLTGPRPLLILSANAVDHALISYAAMSQGTPIAPVSPQYGLPGANLMRLTYACEVLKPAAVYTADAALFADGLGADCLAGLPVVAASNLRQGDIPLERFYAEGEAGPTARPDDHAKYLLTSGSTGLPKAVICTHRMLSANSAQIAACFEDPDPQVLVNSAPWSHSMGANSVMHLGLHRGASLYVDTGQPTAAKFAETLRNLRDVPPTYHSMVPAGWALLAEELDRDEGLARAFFSRLKIMQYGGAALSQAIGDRIQAAALRAVGERITFGSAYGATETGPVASNVQWNNDRMGVMGLPLPGTAVRLVPAAGKLEFRVKGPQVTPGYLGRPELSAAAFDDEGFYILGDAARLIDPQDPAKGLAFDGRISENFKLANGTFVNCGEIRIGATAAVGAAATDAVVCGEGEEGVALLFYPNPTLPHAEVEAAVRTGVAAYNATAKGASSRVARALVLPGPPDAGAGEITDKGYISQALARAKWAERIAELFADPPPKEALVF